MIHRKRLHLLPEKCIVETLSDFNIQEDIYMNNTNTGLIVLDERDILKTDTTIIKINLDHIAIYPYKSILLKIDM